MHDFNKKCIDLLKSRSIDFIVVGETAFDVFDSDNNVVFDSFNVLLGEDDLNEIKSVFVDCEFHENENIIIVDKTRLKLFLSYKGYTKENIPFVNVEGIKIINPELLIDVYFNSNESKMFEEQIAYLAFLIYYNDMTEEEKQAYYRHSRI